MIAAIRLSARRSLARWMPSEDGAVRLADALDAEDGGRRRLELGRPEAAVRRRAWGLWADRLEGADLLVERASVR